MTGRITEAAMAVAVAAALLAGCGGDGDKTCTVGTTEGCGEGLVCEPVASSDPACFAPVVLQGRVFDLTDDAPIEGATVVALDGNQASRSPVAVSAADGTYELQVETPRDADGNPQADSVTLRVSAAGYRTFPKAPRTALPIDLSSGTMGDENGWVVQSSATDVGLLPLREDTSGFGSIEGRIAHDEGRGTLVVAEQGGSAVSTAIADTDGGFLLFNVPEGDVTVKGFRAGLGVQPETVAVAGERVTGVVLEAGTDGLSTVNGKVEIVNAPGGAQTSVILVVQSTFDPDFIRGDTPAGLRAFPVTGDFTIEDVPPGDYTVLAAFENDDLVRDPDESIGGTAIVDITVPEGGGTVNIDQGFKVTEALDVVSPGAMGLGTVSGGTPTFEWADDSSEDGYELRVFDAYGEMLHEDTMVPSVSGSATVTYDWSDASLDAGMIYQFRAVSFREPPSGTRTYISATEDLKGAFVYAP